jgi:hypothetical protein
VWQVGGKSVTMGFSKMQDESLLISYAILLASTYAADWIADKLREALEKITGDKVFN